MRIEPRSRKRRGADRKHRIALPVGECARKRVNRRNFAARVATGGLGGRNIGAPEGKYRRAIGSSKQIRAWSDKRRDYRLTTDLAEHTRLSTLPAATTLMRPGRALFSCWRAPVNDARQEAPSLIHQQRRDWIGNSRSMPDTLGQAESMIAREAEPDLPVQLVVDVQYDALAGDIHPNAGKFRFGHMVSLERAVEPLECGLILGLPGFAFARFGSPYHIPSPLLCD
ncbi:MAG: hypothetical protein JO084_12470 [Bradyrhizobiaceae bacterium]|nr:hypothetical protein [Bradyrhizobiaceae bacterium]